MSVQSTLFRALYRLRRFEETVLENFHRGVFTGTTHTYIGQEANAVGVLDPIQPHDLVVSNHRCHGHFLAYGGPMDALFAELMGKATGVCGGRGGSQHLHWRNFYSNGILGGTIPIATGMALAEKRKGCGSVLVAFMGDGALGEGVVYEALNMAALWEAPALYVLENNYIAQTTPIELNLAGDIGARFTAFGIPHQTLDSSDVTQIRPVATELLREVRETQTPRALVLHTQRLGPHSKGDDTRPAELLDRIRRECDPLAIQADRLDPEHLAEIQADVQAEVARSFQTALDAPDPKPAGDTLSSAEGRPATLSAPLPAPETPSH